LDRLAQSDGASGGGRSWFRAGTPRRSTWPIERAIWRAGELRLREAEPLLIRWIGTGGTDPQGKVGKGLRDYCIAWALGRCDGDAAMRALTDLYGNAPSRSFSSAMQRRARSSKITSCRSCPHHSSKPLVRASPKRSRRHSTTSRCTSKRTCSIGCT
jgi:hypothetical protein